MADDDPLFNLGTDAGYISEKMKNIFKMFDQDDDELINMEEMKGIFNQMGQDPSEDELIDMLVEVDEDQNGTIEIEEFKVMIDKMMEDSDDLVIEAFKVFDADQDGKIKKAEFTNVMMKLGENLTEKEIDQIYREADDDDNGYITFDEFNTVYQNLIAE